MAPDKLEKYIQGKLREREIAPSENAWQRISDGLEHTATAPVRKKKVAWYAVAASVAALVGFSLFYVQNTPVTKPQADGVVVSRPDRPAGEEEGIMAVQQKESKENVKDTAPRATITETSLKKEIAPSVLAVMEQDPDKDLGTGVSHKETKQRTKALERAQISDAVLSEKITEVMVQVAQMEKSQSVSEAEIDSLLHAAQRAIITERRFIENNEVNAMALLAEVEEELDQSFRDQIFESLKSGFLKVRTAVADRNN